MKRNLKNIIIDYLHQYGKLKNNDAVELLDVSLSTVRRLMIELEEQNLVTRIHGGVQLNGDVSRYLFSEKELKNANQKIAIADFAANNLIDDQDVIYLDSGTTIKQLALAISRNLLSDNLKELTVITNSLANMEILNDFCEVILIGGIYREKRKDFAGFATERFLECFNYQKAFFGADGFDISTGYSGNDPLTASINETVKARTSCKHVLIDSSKFNTIGFVSYASVADIDILITDENITAEKRSQLEENNIKYYAVEL
ncbi:MAG TPA: DeoR/GlpR transcriptional regulator [Clostridiaceae bacterium]|nr:DeoR/GlpR transcriptional regulator [Clostridiaceae bacterium]